MCAQAEVSRQQASLAAVEVEASSLRELVEPAQVSDSKGWRTKGRGAWAGVRLPRAPSLPAVNSIGRERRRCVAPAHGRCGRRGGACAKGARACGLWRYRQADAARAQEEAAELELQLRQVGRRGVLVACRTA
jgi:hypothetical protein